jgi:hypothetical protein
MSGVGALQVQNNLSEFAAVGAAAQRACRLNLAAPASPGVNPVDYGADPTGAADCSAAVAAAHTAAVVYGSGCIQFPAGTFYLAAPVTLSVAANSSLSILGVGSQVTTLKFAAGIDGIVLNYQSSTASAHVRYMSLVTLGASGTTRGITYNQIGTFGVSPNSDVTDVALHGADGIAVADYWGTAVQISGVSQVNLCGLYVIGPAPGGSGYVTSDLCTGVGLVGTSAVPAVVFNLEDCVLNYLGVAVSYGAYVQGVALCACNITGGYEGIVTATGSSGTGQDELSVALTQINVYLVAVNVSSVQDVLLCGGNLIIVIANGIGVQLTNPQRFSVTGTSVLSIGASTDGIVVIGYGAGAGVITGNVLDGHTTAVWLQSGSQYVNVQSNAYSGNGTNVLNQGTNNTVGGGSP